MCNMFLLFSDTYPVKKKKKKKKTCICSSGAERSFSLRVRQRPLIQLISNTEGVSEESRFLQTKKTGLM